MTRSVRNRISIAFAVAAGLLATSGLFVAVGAVRGVEQSAWSTGLAAGVLVAALLALAALFLMDRQEDGSADGVGDVACAACGRPIVEEWRLCPHCGELLECDLSLPAGGGPIRG